jgi:hypothetical protein
VSNNRVKAKAAEVVTKRKQTEQWRPYRVTFGFVDNVIYSPYCCTCVAPSPLVLLATPFIYSTKCSADTQYISNIYNVQEELLQLNKTTLVYVCRRIDDAPGLKVNGLIRRFICILSGAGIVIFNLPKKL